MDHNCSLDAVLANRAKAFFIILIGLILAAWVFSIEVLAHFATVVAVVVAIFGGFIALNTYISNNSIRKWELIRELYEKFLKDDWFEFYKKIAKGEQINLNNNNDEKLLNETLTMFDALNYFNIQKLLDEKAWEYIACEIQNFALNNSVWEYMKMVKEPYLLKGFPEKIIPFTGFPELLGALPDEFEINCPQQFKERFEMLSKAEQNFYYDMLKDIPDKKMKLKHALAIGLFVNAKGGTTLEEKYK